MKVLDENDNAPVFTQNAYRVSVTENNIPGTLLYVSATDRDENENGEIGYKLNEGSRQNFNVEDSGRISIQSSLDYETNTDHIIHVFAYDLGTPSHTSTATITINIIK